MGTKKDFTAAAEELSNALDKLDTTDSEAFMSGLRKLRDSLSEDGRVLLQGAMDAIEKEFTVKHD